MYYSPTVLSPPLLCPSKRAMPTRKQELIDAWTQGQGGKSCTTAFWKRFFFPYLELHDIFRQHLLSTIRILRPQHNYS